MSTHAGPGHVPALDRCRWAFHWEDADLWCDELAVPSVGFCATHFIELAHRREDKGIEAKP